METIIGLLIVLVPVLFKVIGKKLEQAGQDGKPVPRPQEGGVADVEAWVKEAAEEAEFVEPVYEPLRKPVETPVRRPVQKVKDEPARSKEKIDPKKLVVYSEIMKPKYTE